MTFHLFVYTRWPYAWPLNELINFLNFVNHVTRQNGIVFIYFRWPCRLYSNTQLYMFYIFPLVMTPMEQHGCILAQFLRCLPPCYCLRLLFVFAWYTLVLEIGVVLFLQDPRLDLEGIIVCASPNSGKIVTRHVGRLPRWGSVQLQYPLNLFSVTVQLDLWTWHLGDSKHK